MSNASRDVTIKITFSNKVVVTRRPNSSHVFSGETITLTCEVQGGETTEWKCDWNRDGSLVNRTNSKDWMFNISESSSGNYMCRCRRRDDWFSSTQWSEAFTLSVSDPNKPSLVLQPNWSQIYRGEKVTLRCEIQGGTQWTYEWRTTNRNSPSSSEYRINSATDADSGEYSCRGKREGFSLTPWSNVVKIIVCKLILYK
ncbi:peroxidasin homolog [Poecilia latipinna]|uniref:peroxidasin homolog n=1 Tax=Poecilia latipinna TaxID=48699 RepID=UPI00072D973A|nr:PREDICTED: peroxidasin homolog [Poecilia latipinna]